MTDFCYGCAVQFGAGEYHNCEFTTYNEDGSCPCTRCIVKTMCDVACDDYVNWKREDLFIKGRK